MASAIRLRVFGLTCRRRPAIVDMAVENDPPSISSERESARSLATQKLFGSAGNGLRAIVRGSVLVEWPGGDPCHLFELRRKRAMDGSPTVDLVPVDDPGEVVAFRTRWALGIGD